MAGGQLPFGFAPQGELTAYEPTLREKAADWLRLKLFTDDRAGQEKANRLVNVGETMLPPFGFATGMYDAGRAGGQGDYLTAGTIGAMAMAPGLKTRGGKSILPHDTGWIFKDVKSPNKVMGKGDWRLTSTLDPQEVELPIGSLNATQRTVNPDFSSPISQNSELPFVIKKNGEYFVQDGHHRLTKIAMDGSQTANVRLVDLDGTTQTDFPLVDMMQKPKGIKAYHGSPHSFDKFSMDKIGTGEGAQAYGHGLYFAENEGVAKGYRDTLSNRDGAGYATAHLNAQNIVNKVGGDAEFAAQVLRDQLDQVGDEGTAQKLRDTLDFITSGKYAEPLPPAGSMYEVNIDADPNAFLDWDKPLSEQPEAVQGFANSLKDKSFLARKRLEDTSTATGKDVWEKARNAFGVGQSDAATKALAEAGIPGIKYLDAGSRVPSAMAKKELADWQVQLPLAEKELADATARGDRWLISRKQAEVQRVRDGISRVSQEADGTRNFVVFDDKLISIVKKYGIAGASAMLGYNLLEGMNPAQADELKRIEAGK